jgi:MoxR-like ATPase
MQHLMGEASESHRAPAIERAHQELRRACDAIQKTMRGKPDEVAKAMVAVAAGGHVLIEDVPGVGKTTLARAVAAAIGGKMTRVQFTSDLLPGDVTGVTILDSSGQFTFRRGPIFTNVLLADEINRAGPKTQSALLESMSERRVTVDGVSHELPQPFVVLATQNPLDFHGTFPLPDSQLDRFLIRMSLGYPDLEHEREILRMGSMHDSAPASALTLEEMQHVIGVVKTITMHEDIEDYLLRIVRTTRSSTQILRGVSTRGAKALYKAAQAQALISGRGFVIPEDVYTLSIPVLAHRIQVRDADINTSNGSEAVMQSILDTVRPPG